MGAAGAASPVKQAALCVLQGEERLQTFPQYAEAAPGGAPYPASVLKGGQQLGTNGTTSWK